MKRVKLLGGTSRCVRCRKPAMAWGGHVRAESGDEILAGWCAKHQRAMPEMWPGWFGWHKRWMGCRRDATGGVSDGMV